MIVILLLKPNIEPLVRLAANIFANRSIFFSGPTQVLDIQTLMMSYHHPRIVFQCVFVGPTLMCIRLGNSGRPQYCYCYAYRWSIEALYNEDRDELSLSVRGLYKSPNCHRDFGPLDFHQFLGTTYYIGTCP